MGLEVITKQAVLLRNKCLFRGVEVAKITAIAEATEAAKENIVFPLQGSASCTCVCVTRLSKSAGMTY